jgi:hypothetical protein
MPSKKRNRRTAGPEPRDVSDKPRKNTKRLKNFLLIVNVPFEEALTRTEFWEKAGAPCNSKGKKLSTPEVDLNKLFADNVIYRVPNSKPHRFYGIHCRAFWEADEALQRGEMWELFTEDQKADYWAARGGKPTTPEEKSMKPTSAEAREKTFEVFAELPQTPGIYYPPDKIGELVGISAQHASTNLGVLARGKTGRLIREKLVDAKTGRKVWHYALPLEAGEPAKLPDTVEMLSEPTPEKTPSAQPAPASAKMAIDLDHLILAHENRERMVKKALRDIQSTIRLLKLIRETGTNPSGILED